MSNILSGPSDSHASDAPTDPPGRPAAPRAAAGRRRTRLAVLLSLSLAAPGCGGPFWYVFPDEGVKQAQKDGKPMLLYFKAWDSTQHRNMSRNVLNNPDVKRELRDTVNIELEFAYAKEYTRQYRVQAAQVCVVAAPDGREVARMFVNPVPEPGKFLEWLKKAKADAKPKPTSRP